MQINYSYLRRNRLEKYRNIKFTYWLLDTNIAQTWSNCGIVTKKHERDIWS